MGKVTLWVAWVLVLACAAAPKALAAQPASAILWQDAPTSTPEPEPGDGQVTARVLVVRAGASHDWVAIGGLNEGEPIDPLGVSADGEWVMIEWEGRPGWVSADFVEWSPGFDPSGLPTVPPPTPIPPTPAPPTPSPPAPTATQLRASPTASMTPTHTATATPTDTPSPTGTATPVASATPAQAAAAPPAAGSGEQSGAIPGRWWPLMPWLGGGGAAALLAAGFYIWQLGRSRRELGRYAGGFLFDACPTCQRGKLHLDEQVKRLFGMPRVQRTIRCDTCRSVLRQVRPGAWRYTIDPLANPDLAERFSPRVFTDAALPAFAAQALSFEPSMEAEHFIPTSPHFESAVEHLASLEATVLASQRAVEEGADGEEHKEGAEAGTETPTPEDETGEEHEEDVGGGTEAPAPEGEAGQEATD